MVLSIMSVPHPGENRYKGNLEFWLFRHRHGKEVLSEETGRGKEVIERREVFDMPGIG
jgi:hypothetical protein